MIANKIYPVLKAYIPEATKITRGWAEQTAAAPYVVWDVLAGNPENNLDLPPTDRYGVSVDVLATTPAQADALIVKARNAMESIGYVETIQSLGRDQESQLWRYTLTADIFINR